MSGEPMAGGVRGVSTWYSRSIHVRRTRTQHVHVEADQEHSDCVVPQYIPVQDGTGMKIFNAHCGAVG